MVDDFKEGRVLETPNSSDYDFWLIYLIAPPFEDIVNPCQLRTTNILYSSRVSDLKNSYFFPDAKSYNSLLFSGRCLL